MPHPEARWPRRRRSRVAAWLVLGGIAVAAPLPGQAVEAGSRIEVVLDVSGSMRGRLGGTDKMEVGRNLVRELHRHLVEADGPAVAGLRVYGASSHRLERDCRDTSLLAAPGDSLASWDAALAAVRALGVSPLATALEAAAADEADVYVLVTDGGDNCGRDACAAWTGLAPAGSRPRLHVVALDPTPADADRLRCLSRAGSGAYIEIDDPGAVERAAERLALVLLNLGRLDVRLTVGDDRFTAPVRVLQPLTREVVAAYVAQGPRRLPAGMYTVVVETAPPRTIERVLVLPGETSTIERDDFGRLVVVRLDRDNARRRTSYSVRALAGGPELRYATTGDTLVLGTGSYVIDLEGGGGRDTVSVAPGATRRLVFGGSGVLRVVAPGIERPPPTLVVASRGEEVDSLRIGDPGPLPAGRYRVVVATVPTYVTEGVAIAGRDTTVLELPPTGVLGLRVIRGDSLATELRAEIVEPSTGERYGALPNGDRRLAMPGRYRLELDTAPPRTVEDVVVAAGRTNIVERSGIGGIRVARARPDGGDLRLVVLDPGGRPLAEAEGREPSIAAWPGEYVVRIEHRGAILAERRISVAPHRTATIDWREPENGPGRGSAP